MRREGYGYEWDAMLVGGPADGCLDRVISMGSNNPPRYTFRIVDGNEMNRETLGEKLIIYLSKDLMDGNQKVAVYRLREHFGEEACMYQYMESTNMKGFREKYEAKI